MDPQSLPSHGVDPSSGRCQPDFLTKPVFHMNRKEKTGGGSQPGVQEGSVSCTRPIHIEEPAIGRVLESLLIVRISNGETDVTVTRTIPSLPSSADLLYSHYGGTG